MHDVTILRGNNCLSCLLLFGKSFKRTLNCCIDGSIWHFKFPKVVQAHTLGEVGILGTVLLRVSSGTILPIFIEIDSYLTDKEQKISLQFFETRCNVTSERYSDINQSDGHRSKPHENETSSYPAFSRHTSYHRSARTRRRLDRPSTRQHSTHLLLHACGPWDPASCRTQADLHMHFMYNTQSTQSVMQLRQKSAVTFTFTFCFCILLSINLLRGLSGKYHC